MSFEELVKKIKKFKAKYHQLIIGIDGGGGAGKTTFANKLASFLDATIIHLDDLYKPTNDRVNEKQNSDINVDFDWERIEKEIFLPIRNNSKISYSYYDWHKDKITHKVDVTQDKTIIIEGGYALQPKFFPDYDFSIWIETPEEIRLARAMIRDGEHMRSYWQKTWLPSDRRYKDIHKIHKNVNLLVNGLESDFEHNIISLDKV